MWSVTVVKITYENSAPLLGHHDRSWSLQPLGPKHDVCAHATILRNVEVAAHALVHDDSCTSRDPAAKVHQDELKEQELFAGLTARREHRGWRLTKKQHTFCDDDHNVHIGRRHTTGC